MSRSTSLPAISRLVGCILILGLMAACATQNQSSTSEAARYRAHAKGNYKPPGPPDDPWGPYIREASTRFDVPVQWIRALMRVESGGRLYNRNGELITSSAGAMGLMQVMPGTYDELRERYDLSDDPYDPRDNIMAGVAYMREMYDIYGSPGFLAAYNGGPARFDDYLTNNRGLPDETRRYVAMIAPNLAGAYPKVRSPAEQYEMNQVPIQIAAGLRYGRGAMQLASNNASGNGRVPSRRPVEVAQLPPEPAQGSSYQPPVQAAYVPPPAPPPAAPQQFASVSAAPLPAPPQSPAPAPTAAPASHGGLGGLHLIAPAMAAESKAFRAGSSAGNWAIQVGAFANQAQATSAINQARDRARAELAMGRPGVTSVHQAKGMLWRARMNGLLRDTAVQACEKLSRGRMNCIVLSPEAQS